VTLFTATKLQLIRV